MHCNVYIIGNQIEFRSASSASHWQPGSEALVDAELESVVVAQLQVEPLALATLGSVDLELNVEVGTKCIKHQSPHKDQVPDLPYLNATTWASHESLHNPTAHDPLTLSLR